MVGPLLQLGFVLFLILLGLIAGKAAERMHFRSLQRREEETRHVLLTNLKSFPGGVRAGSPVRIVQGEAVIATDYLKSFLAGFRKIVGGEIRSYESLMVRARREAIMRMVEQALGLGCDSVCNIRLNTADIGGGMRRRGMAMAEMMATGTAYCRNSRGAHAARQT